MPLGNGLEIGLQKGSRLAIGPVIQLQSSPLHMLRVRENPDLPEGSFFVEAQSQPFLFVVNASSKLHAYLRRGAGSQRSNIMVHIVTSCLRLLPALVLR